MAGIPKAIQPIMLTDAQLVAAGGADSGVPVRYHDVVSGRNCLSESNRWPTYYEEDESRSTRVQTATSILLARLIVPRLSGPSIAVVSKSVSTACPW